MKIGVLTYHCVPNFGAQLQALSTVGFLKRMGHVPILLHWYPKDLEQQYARQVSKTQIKCQMTFALQHYPLSQLCRNEDELVDEIESLRLDMIVTGSDALFKYIPRSERRSFFSRRKLRFINNYISCEDLVGNPFFCDYYGKLKNKIPVVAFSVSSQSCPYHKMNSEEIGLMKRHLSNFKAISVRDVWTKQMVESILGEKDINITPDPVFCFNKNNYLQIPDIKELQSKFGIPDRYVLITFSKGVLDTDYVAQILNIFQKNNITPIILPEPEGHGDFECQQQISLPLNPLEWYALIKNSTGYIGTRMHPIITCLHNAVPFFSFDGNGTINSEGHFEQKSSKVYDILLKANLEDYTYALKSGLPKPSAETIFERIQLFDKERCANFSIKMQTIYEEEMCKIINV